MRYQQQFDETDCGAACLAMIASNYGSRHSITYIREIAGTDRKGTNLEGMVKAAKEIGLEARALKGTMEAFTNDLPVPFIAHVAIPGEYGILLHYVIVKKIKKNRIVIWDPDDTKKKYKMEKDDFFKIWTGYVIFVSPNRDFKPEKGSGNLLFKFFPIIKPYKNILILAGVASLLLIVFGIVSSFYFRYIIDELLFSSAHFTLGALSVGVLCIALLQAIISAIRNSILTHFSYKIDLNLVLSYFSHVFHLPFSFFDSRKTGEILSRLEDITKIRDVLSQAVVSVVMDTMMLLVIAPVLFATNWLLFVIVLFSLPFTSIILVIFSKLYRKQFRELMKKNSDMQAHLVESINGVATVKALNAESVIFNQYEVKKTEVAITGWKAMRYRIYQMMSTDIVKQFSSIVIFWVGSYLIMEGNASIGTLISFTSLASYFTGPLERLVNLQSTLQEAYVAADRLGEIFDLDREQSIEKRWIRPVEFKGEIEFKDVSFRYGTRKMIYQDLSFSINAGDFVAFVGPSGCGKTTLIKLLLKFYSAHSGNILIDGIDSNDLDTQYLRSRIGYVPQEIMLFSGSIAENIALHKSDASLEEIIEVAKRTGAHDFIERLPDRYNTILGERGATLSGGERQRIALTRALLGAPDILIFDEATSNLDSISEKRIHDTIREICSKNITTIMIAHRLSTVSACDKIFVLDNGEIVESGSHIELSNANGLYQSLFEGMLV
ncbi:MAG: peptidase domain-containing ABC transporter [Bacteroidales bacterium]|nr:peptidase domain-containing ABC transporter [Bacteroidales bacterium]